MDTLKYQKYLLKIRSFLLSQKAREFLFFLFFMLVSASFWLLQSLNETFDINLKMPVRLTEVPSFIVITSDLPKTLDITVRDKGILLVRYLYGYEFTPLTVDYSKLENTDVSGRVVVPMEDIQKRIQAQLLSSTKLVSVHPDTLEFYFNRGIKKKVPVHLAGEIETSPEYYLETVRCEPDSVIVYAPLNILDTITSVRVMPLHIEGLEADTKIRKVLQTVRGAKLVPSQVEIGLGVDLYTEKSLEVPIVGINFPASKKLRTFPSKVQVRFRVGMTRFKEIEADDFIIAVSYEELIENKQPRIKLHLKSMPDGVSNVRLQPEEVDYLIEQISDEE